MNTEQTALNERALQELASIQADIDNKRDPETYQKKVQYLGELVSDLPRDRQGHFYAEARRLKLDLSSGKTKDQLDYEKRERIDLPGDETPTPELTQPGGPATPSS